MAHILNRQKSKKTTGDSSKMAKSRPRMSELAREMSLLSLASGSTCRNVNEESDPAAFYDVDGSRIVVTEVSSVSKYIITAPYMQSSGLHVVLISEGAHGKLHEHMSRFVNSIKKDRTIGLDVETDLGNRCALVQVSSATYCILIRVRFGCFKGDVMKTQLGRILEDPDILKTGASVVGDVENILTDLGVCVRSYVDLTPLYSKGKKLLGLKAMFDMVTACNWTKDKEITTSDWTVKDLSLEQIKYAALDAYASYMAAVKFTGGADALLKAAVDPVGDELLGDIMALAEAFPLVSSARHKHEKQPFVPGQTFAKLGTDGTTVSFDMRSYNERVLRGYIITFANGAKGYVTSIYGKEAFVKPINGRKGAIPEGTMVTSARNSDGSSVTLARTHFSVKSLFSSLLRDKLDRLTPQIVALLKGEPFDNKARCRAASEWAHLLPTRLNSVQRSAMENVLKSVISIVWGPPGTGKTTWIAALVGMLRVLHPDDVIIVTSQSNKAVDFILQKLLAAGRTDMLRLISDDYFEWHQTTFTPEEKSWQVFSSDGEAAWGKWANRHPRSAMPSVICSTLCGLGNDRFFEGLYNRRCVMIIDECSQVWEADVLVGFVNFTKLRRAVLVGDDKQLPPFDPERENSNNNNTSRTKSIFHIATAHPSVQKDILTVQYRMPPKVREFVSRHFYEGRLNDGKAPVKNAPSPIIWYDFASPEKRNQSSWTNLKEAEWVIWYTAERLKKSADAIVITPYVQQRKYIDGRLAEYKYEGRVFCIDGYQGREADEIIISLVRSNEKATIGFLNSMERTNVLLSRCKKQIILFGDHKMFLRSSNVVW
eukprot:CAMPEP_0184652894 /NCGR_PEP_ID=MMETSP0308-20130426/10612_1 /TAXON_ID=38269 /ORGANISM="Gloeochaete witrockiana, Strain SAG 46.84" /LENGTH=824 /DNA_ID=CAMNT_0027088051 /DNA_START=124 /DNA_END=2595 /DNA_ORIENTATION=+